MLAYFLNHHQKSEQPRLFAFLVKKYLYDNLTGKNRMFIRQ